MTGTELGTIPFEGVPLILYGAGRHASWELNALRRKGMNPVCFCDADPNKWGTRHLGLPVLGPDGVKSAHPRFRIHIALAEPLRYEAQKQLVEEGVFPKDAIINYAEASWRKSCGQLETILIVNNGSLDHCCGVGDVRNQPPHSPWGATSAETVEAFLATRDRLIRDNQEAMPATPCANCPELRESFFADERKVRTIVYGLPHPCQYACVYCDVPNACGRKVDAETQRRLDSFDFKDFLDCLKRKGLLALDEPIQLSGGEISINPRRDSLLDAVEGFPAMIFTNGAVYNRRIAEKIREPGSFIFLSLDAGTGETYRRVKGLDMFDRVTANIRRYREGGGEVKLKYIVLPENRGKADLEGFVSFCLSCDIRDIHISSDVRFAAVRKSESVLDAVIRLHNLASKNHLEVTIAPYFDADSLKIIQDGIDADRELAKQKPPSQSRMSSSQAGTEDASAWVEGKSHG